MPAIHDDGAQAREAIRNEAIDRSQAGGNLLLIIDQADQLDAETLNDIAHFALVAPQAISVILFGAPGYETYFRNSPAQAPIHVLAVEPLSDSEITVLMASVFGDGEVCPFGDKELADIMMDSGCLPGPALRQGERILSSATRAVSSSPAGGFPVRNILAIAGVVTAIAMVFMYQWGAASADDELSPEIQAQLDSAKDFNYPDASVEPQAQPEVGSSKTLALPDRAVVEAESRVAASSDVTALSSSDIQPEGKVVSSAPESVSDTGSDAKPVSRAEVQPVEATAESITTSSEPVKIGTSSYTPDEQALLAPESGYIVQLLGSHSSSGAETFRNQWQSQITGSLYRYQTTYKGKDWFVVVSGVYSSRAEARAAVNAMPASLRKQSPWVRPLGDVQKVIR
jgi:DamX protein